MGAVQSAPPPAPAPPDAELRQILLSRPARAVALLTLFGAVCEFVPALAPLRVFSPRPTAPESAAAPTRATLEVGQSELSLETQARAPADALPEEREPAPAASAVLPAPPVPLFDPSGRALSGFFEALARTERRRPGAVTRIVHFGDSIVAGDWVSGTLRRQFQDRFGDAGHGFTLIANAWPSYFHNDVERYATAGWKVSRVVGPLSADGLYGLGCVSFSAEKNVLARVGTALRGDFGRAVSRFGISYLRSPNGGSFDVSIDGKFVERVSTQSDVVRSELREFEVPDGPHRLEILTTSGISRVFGVILERAGPGVVLDAIGIQGARVRFLDKQDDAHWAEQLQQRGPALLTYQFGANESADGLMYPMVDYHRTLRQVVEQGQRALPNSSCLIIGAMDRATKRGEELSSVGVIPHLIREQQRVAEELGCAFFDAYRAMGGPGSMARWVKRGLGQADLTHPSGAGAELLGTWIFRALLQRYGEMRADAGRVSPSSAGNSESSKSSPSR